MTVCFRKCNIYLSHLIEKDRVPMRVTDDAAHNCISVYEHFLLILHYFQISIKAYILLVVYVPQYTQSQHHGIIKLQTKTPVAMSAGIKAPNSNSMFVEFIFFSSIFALHKTHSSHNQKINYTQHPLESVGWCLWWLKISNILCELWILKW